MHGFLSRGRRQPKLGATRATSHEPTKLGAGGKRCITHATSNRDCSRTRWYKKIALSTTVVHSDSTGPLVHHRLGDKMNAARRLAGGLRRGYSLGEVEAAAGRALKDGVCSGAKPTRTCVPRTVNGTGHVRYAFWVGQPYRRGLSRCRNQLVSFVDGVEVNRDPAQASPTRARRSAPTARPTRRCRTCPAARAGAGSAPRRAPWPGSRAPGPSTGATASLSAAASSSPRRPSWPRGTEHGVSDEKLEGGG